MAAESLKLGALSTIICWHRRNTAPGSCARTSTSRHVLPSLCGRFVGLFVLVILATAAGCAPLIAEYNADAYKNATTLKAETLSLIDKSGDRFAKRQVEIEVLTTKIDAAYEYAAGIPNNQISAQQWQLLRDPNGALYGTFIRIWRQQETTGAFFRSQMRGQMSAAFDTIICLEVNKKSAKACAAVAAQVDAGGPRPAGGAPL